MVSCRPADILEVARKIVGLIRKNLPNSSSSILEIEMSGVLSSSSRTTLSKLFPLQRDLIPDFFFNVSKYSSSSFAEVSSSIKLPFLVKFEDEVCDSRLACWAESFHFPFFEDIFSDLRLNARYTKVLIKTRCLLKKTVLKPSANGSEIRIKVDTHSDLIGLLRRLTWVVTKLKTKRK